MKRPENLLTKTREVRTGCGKLYITYSLPGQGYNEVYGLLGKTGGCSACMISALTRTITIGWNAGAKIEKIIKQLDGSKCPHMDMMAKSCPQAIADVLKDTQLKKSEIGSLAIEYENDFDTMSGPVLVSEKPLTINLHVPAHIAPGMKRTVELAIAEGQSAKDAVQSARDRYNRIKDASWFKSLIDEERSSE